MTTPQKRDTPASGGEGDGKISINNIIKRSKHEGDQDTTAADTANCDAATTTATDSTANSPPEPGNAQEREILNPSVMMNNANSHHSHAHHHHHHPRLHNKEEFLQYSGKKAPRVGDDFQATILPAPVVVAAATSAVNKKTNKGGEK